MGSFNTTCAISRSEIKPYQKAYVFFLIYDAFSSHYNLREKNFFSNSFSGSSCHPESHFKIIGYPLLGTYYDYNQYLFKDKELEQLTLNSIKEIYIPNKKTEGLNNYNTSHDFLNIPDIHDMKQLQEMEHFGSLRVKSYHGVSFVSKMAIHQDIYEKLILNHKEKSPYLLKNNFEEISLSNLYSYFSIKEPINIKSEFESLNIFEKNMILMREKYLYSNIGKQCPKGNIITEDYILKEKEKEITQIVHRPFNDDKLTELFRFLYSTSNYNRDVEINLSMREKITQKISEMYIFNLWLTANNVEILPSMISNPDYDHETHVDNLLSIAAFTHGRTSYFDEESIPHSRSLEVIKKINISVTDIEKTLLSWFEISEDTYPDIFLLLNEIKNKKITTFLVGDGSDADLTFKKHHLIKDIENNTLITFY